MCPHSDLSQLNVYILPDLIGINLGCSLFVFEKYFDLSNDKKEVS